MSATSFPDLTEAAANQVHRDRPEVRQPGGALGLLNGTRRDILVLLGQRGFAGVRELAPLLGVSVSAARQQLALLKAQGLVVQHYRNGSWPRSGPGRPSCRFSLTAAGERLFPSDYETVAGFALDVLSSAEMGWLVDAVAKRYFEGLMLPATDEGPVTAAGMEVLAESLSDAGFNAEVENSGQFEGVVSILSCPIAGIARRFPTFCAAEHAAMVAAAAGSKVKRVAHIRAGDRVCAYKFEASPGGSRFRVEPTPGMFGNFPPDHGATAVDDNC